MHVQLIPYICTCEPLHEINAAKSPFTFKNDSQAQVTNSPWEKIAAIPE